MALNNVVLWLCPVFLFFFFWGGGVVGALDGAGPGSPIKVRTRASEIFRRGRKTFNAPFWGIWFQKENLWTALMGK